MLDSSRLLPLARHLPLWFDGPGLHRAALLAMWEGRYEAADLLFERAARCYREQTRVEPLARLRVHQLMARVRSGVAPREADALILDVERRLCRLSRVESLAPPFAMVDARDLLAGWLTARAAGSGEREAVRPAA